MQLAKGTTMKNSTQFELLIQLPFYFIAGNIPFSIPGWVFFCLWKFFNIVPLVWENGRFLFLSHQYLFLHETQCQADKFIFSLVCFQSRAPPLVNQCDVSEGTAQEVCGSRLSQHADTLEKRQLMSGKAVRRAHELHDNVGIPPRILMEIEYQLRVV